MSRADNGGLPGSPPNKNPNEKRGSGSTEQLNPRNPAEPPREIQESPVIRNQKGFRPALLSGGLERSQYGCICTFENEEGKRLVLHDRDEAPGKVAQELWDYAESLDPSFRLVSYSTPDTTYTDLIGRKGVDQEKPNLPEFRIVAERGRR